MTSRITRSIGSFSSAANMAAPFLRNRYDVRMLAEEIRQQGQDVLVIIDQQQMGHRQHSPRTTRAVGRVMSVQRVFVSA